MMKVVLADDVPNLGHKGDVVNVADGYARHHLVPKGLALIPGEKSLHKAEQMQRAREEQERRANGESTAKAGQTDIPLL